MVLNKTNNGVLGAENISRSTNDTSQGIFGVIIPEITVHSIILVIALVGNSLIFCICMRKDNRKKAFMLYLAALSISDTVACFTFAPGYIDLIPGFSWGSPDVYCKLTYFIFSTTPYISSWLTVAISFERTVSTKLPHHVARISSQGFGIKTISIIVLTCSLVNSHTLYGVIGFTNGYIFWCSAGGTYAVMQMYFAPVINGLLYSLIPGTLIILCNTVMVNAVFSSAKVRGTISDQVSKRNRELMIVAVTVSMSFVILTSPYCLYVLFSGELHDPEYSEKPLTDWVTGCMMQFNHAVNFFFYILSGSRFRQQLKELVLCKACRRM